MGTLNTQEEREPEIEALRVCISRMSAANLRITGNYPVAQAGGEKDCRQRATLKRLVPQICERLIGTYAPNHPLPERAAHACPCQMRTSVVCPLAWAGAAPHDVPGCLGAPLLLSPIRPYIVFQQCFPTGCTEWSCHTQYQHTLTHPKYTDTLLSCSVTTEAISNISSSPVQLRL